MFPLYLWGATYYSCGQPLSRTTAAYLKGCLGQIFSMQHGNVLHMLCSDFYSHPSYYY